MKNVSYTCAVVVLITILFPVAVSKRCRHPGLMPNTQSTSGRLFIDPNVVVNFRCNKRYEVVTGDKLRRCQNNGQWTGSPLQCQRDINCTDPGTPEGATRQGSCCEVDNVLTYTCRLGTELEGSHRLQCMDLDTHNEWSNTIPNCTVTTSCPDPTEEFTTRQVRKADPSVPGVFLPNDQIYFQCRSYHILNTGNEIDESNDYGNGNSYNSFYEEPKTTPMNLTCGADGHWDNAVPSCTAISCKPPKGVRNGVFEKLEDPPVNITDDTVFTGGDRIKIECDYGYTITEYETFTCDPNDVGSTSGQWKPTMKTNTYCEKIFCRELILENGEITDCQISNNSCESIGQFPVGSTVTFKCNSGYKMMGSPSRTCTESGHWTGVYTTCEDTGHTSTCDHPGMPEGGFKVGNNYNVGDMVKYSCDGRFRLKGSAERTCLQNGEWTGSMPYCEGDDIASDPKAAGLSLGESFDKLSEKSNDSPQNADAAMARAINIADGVDLYVFIDQSGSITKEVFELAKEFVKTLIEKTGVSKFPGGTSLGLYTFGNEVTPHIPIHNTANSVDEAKAKIDELHHNVNQGTSIMNVIIDLHDNYIPTRERERELSELKNEPQIAIVLITDGMFNTGGNPAETEALKELKKKRTYGGYGAEIFCIAVGKKPNKEVLEKIASLPLPKHVFTVEKASVFSKVIDDMTEDIDHTECGIAGHTQLNKKGNEKESAPDAWPWQVQIRKDGFHLCGGSLIGDNWVLTAAHCFPPTRDEDDKFSVYLGLTDRDQQDFQNIGIKEIIPHPNYDSTVVPKHDSDIALIQLVNTFEATAKTKQVCLPDETKYQDVAIVEDTDWFETNRYGVVTGWGKRTSGENMKVKQDQNFPNELWQKQMRIQEEAKCEESLKNATEQNEDVYNPKTMFCAGDTIFKDGEPEQIDACVGDSGGPYVRKKMVNETSRAERFFQIGIVSYGFGCRIVDRFGMYTRLTDEFLQWINATMIEHP